MRRASNGAGTPLVRVPPERRALGRRHLLFSLGYGALAIAAFGVGTAIGTLHGTKAEPKVVAGSSAAAFVVFGALATRALARALAALMTARAARAAGSAVRLLVTAVGYLIVLFGALGLLGVNAGHLLVGGTIAGIVLGIAAQQSLSNVFAGFVLSFARPFVVGDNVRVRAGALNGPFDGVVLGTSLTYVTMFVEGGVLKVPNSAMLSAAVGQYPVKDRAAADAARAAGAPFTPPQGIAAVPGPVVGAPPPGDGAGGGAAGAAAGSGPVSAGGRADNGGGAGSPATGAAPEAPPAT